MASVTSKTGDEGTSSLFDGSRSAKDDPVFEALGAIDECQAHVGNAHRCCKRDGNGLHDMLHDISCRLMDAGAAVATPRPAGEAEEEGGASAAAAGGGEADGSETRKQKLTSFPEAHAEALEAELKRHEAELPRLTNFVLPSGCESSCLLHIARTSARRAERRVWTLVRAGTVHRAVAVYLNRLSDYLFVAARVASRHSGEPEIAYVVSKHVEKPVQ